jgi:drug/metabolite transporter (DMT)-like permease
MELPADRRVLAAFVAVILLGGTNLVLIVFTTRELDPLWGAGLRFSGAGILSIVAASALVGSLPRGRVFGLAALYGILGFGISFGLFYWGTQRVPAGIASVVLGSVPLLTLLLASVQRLEPFRLRGLVGACVTIGGIALISTGSAEGVVPLVPLLAVVAAAITAAQSTLMVRRIRETHPLLVNSVGISVGAVWLLTLSFVLGESHALPSSTSVWIALAFMVVTTPVLFMLFVFMIQRWTASASSYALVLFPLVSIPMAVLLLDESVSGSLLLGAPLVLVGVYVGALTTGRGGVTPVAPMGG